VRGLICKKGIWCEFMWDEFQFIEHGGRRILSGQMHGFATGGVCAGHRYSQTEYERCDVQALDLSRGLVYMK